MLKRVHHLGFFLLIAASFFIAISFVPNISARQQNSNPAAAPSATANPAQSENPGIITLNNVTYGGGAGGDLRVDIFEPPHSAGQTFPAVILLHGGGWTDLDKMTMRGMGVFLARAGFVAVAVDYRLFRNGFNRWPAQLDDCQRAVRWIRANAAQYAVNPDRVGAFGHSAGAQLAALLGMEDTRDNSDATLAKYSSRVQAVVDVSGPTDFTMQIGSDFLNSLFGGDFTTHPEVWRDASPISHAAKDDAPFLIFHGTQDGTVPMAQAQELVEKLQAAGANVKFEKVDDGHTFQTPEAKRRLAIDSAAFFNPYLVPSS
jgi:acetyl esterase/lipase